MSVGTPTGAALRAKLLSDSAVTGMVSARIYPLRMPQNPTLPAVTLFEVFGRHPVAHDGPLGARESRQQIDAWAATYGEARALADAIRIALNGWHQGNGAEQLQAVQLVDERELCESDAEHPETGKGIYRVSADYQVTKMEAAA